jgi:sec-independent protein translocase protein TatB
MFDFAWSELALIAAVALVVIGPKDLPRTLRIVGQWVRKARAIAREFQGNLDQMVREAELDDIKRDIDRATSFDFDRDIRQAIDPGGEIQRSLSAPVLTDPLADVAAKPAGEGIPFPSDPAAPAEPQALPAPPDPASAAKIPGEGAA